MKTFNKTMIAALVLGTTAMGAQASSWENESKDAWIDGKAETVLLMNTNLNNFDINTDVKNGKVILTGKGLLNQYNLKTIRERLPELTLIVDAGLGLPSHACQALELGYDGVLLNSAIAGAGCPVTMSHAFKAAVDAGRFAYKAKAMPEKDVAAPSTPTMGMPFWHQT